MLIVSGAVIVTQSMEVSVHPDEIITIVKQFNASLNARDVDTMMRLMTQDCVFENTNPPPDGSRYEGQRAVRSFWEGFFAGSTSSVIEIEEIFCLDQCCVMLWTYRWTDASAQPGHIRGVDIYTIRDGLIAKKLSYVKG